MGTCMKRIYDQYHFLIQKQYFQFNQQRQHFQPLTGYFMHPSYEDKNPHLSFVSWCNQQNYEIKMGKFYQTQACEVQDRWTIIISSIDDFQFDSSKFIQRKSVKKNLLNNLLLDNYHILSSFFQFLKYSIIKII
ncbi:unnamed protein product [Paramecium sonneborni]|uniref:Uncharacterized protein n=1 Tax=Paramecium sonneborni TaxID=65129 RepID=A0A8S1L1Y3_9CILI|nr:unnamed protein product [Paramecium sonneborni]